jgi:hypothetical protein
MFVSFVEFNPGFVYFFFFFLIRTIKANSELNTKIDQFRKENCLLNNKIRVGFSIVKKVVF